MNRKILISLFVIGILALSIGWGTHSLFSDTETSKDNIFTAGTLDLKVNGNDDPVAHVTVSNIAPGWSSGDLRWTLKNAGSLSGILWLEFTNIVNNENGLEEPEIGADGENGGEPGELGDYLKHKLNFYGVGGYSPSYRPRIGSQSGSPIGHWLSINSLDGLKLYYEVNLEPGQQIDFCMVLKLDSTVGNCVQGDSLTFDIVFHLEQVPP